ncbi:D-xylose ABC transporter ATP-binding protein, partial [Candidatus Aerophobetes bacterium]
NDKKVVENMIHKLEIKTPFIRQLVRYLSGGNKQKVVLAKWLLAQPKILLIDQPTMGLDIGAKIEIYKILRQLSNKGISTLVVLAELEEVTNLPDRVLVMREGQIVNEFIGEIKDEELLDSYYV